MSKATNGYILLTGTANIPLAQEIARILDKQLYEPVSFFADGEIKVTLPITARNMHVVIIQPTCGPVNDHVMELLLMIDAARRSSALEISTIIPYFGYSRQDRKDAPHVPISSAMVANLIEYTGADRIVTLDIHSDQQQGFIKGSWDNLYASHTLIPYLEKKKLTNLIVASPDKGGAARASAYAKRMGADGIAIVYKERDTSVKNVSKALDMIGNVNGKNVLLVDDIIDTAGSTKNAAKLLKARGAKKVIVAATHGLFSGSAAENLSDEALDEVIITNTVPVRKEILENPKVSVVSVAPFLAEVIRRTHEGISLSPELID